MGSTFPRVTTIIEQLGLGPDFSMVPAAVMEQARIRGTLVHKAIEAITYNYYDADEYTEVAPYLDAYQRFLRESKFEPRYAEIEVVHDVWKYQGHPDSVGLLGKIRLLIDYKTGESDGVEYQLAAYVEAWNHQHPQEPVGAAACVELRRDGTYRFNEIEIAPAWPVFQAAVTVWHARQRRAA